MFLDNFREEMFTKVYSTQLKNTGNLPSLFTHPIFVEIQWNEWSQVVPCLSSQLQAML